MKIFLRRQLVPLGLFAVLVLVLQAKEPWADKPPAEWSRETVLTFLRDSPWAEEKRLYQLTGRMLAVFRDGVREYKVVYREGPRAPARIFDRQPERLEPERAEAVYAVRWDSAAIVQQAFTRLRQLSKFHAQALAPPEEIPEDHYALTARVVKPPSTSVFDRLDRPRVVDEEGRPVEDRPAQTADIFAGLTAEELQERAELRTSEKTVVKAARAVRHGLGASEGITFYFPHTKDGQATLPPNAEWGKFYFKGAQGNELEVEFSLDEMQRNGQPDY